MFNQVLNPVGNLGLTVLLALVQLAYLIIVGVLYYFFLPGAMRV